MTEMPGLRTLRRQKKKCVEWNNYPLILSKLEAYLAQYQLLDSQTEQDKDHQLKDDMTKEILGNEKLRKVFHSNGYTDGDIHKVQCCACVIFCTTSYADYF